MSSPNSPITLVHKRKYVLFIFQLKLVEYWIVRVSLFCSQKLGFKSFCVRFGARAKIHFLLMSQLMKRGVLNILAVLVNKACGHVPHRKFLHTWNDREYTLDKTSEDSPFRRTKSNSRLQLPWLLGPSFASVSGGKDNTYEHDTIPPLGACAASLLADPFCGEV